MTGFLGGGAEPISESTDTFGFGPPGRVTFSSRGKSNQKRLPLHAALRCAQGSFVPSLLQGSAYKGHPWPFKPFAASMPLNPLRSDSTHPPERGG